MKNYINHIQLQEQSEGNERRLEMLSDILKDGSFLPKTVNYKDIDEAFKEWAENELPIQSDEGKEFPTMTLFSNQRFSEYTQTWKHVDENNNILLNFKTVNRDNNPQYGNIESKLWNIPGEHFYLMKRKHALDDNGTESFLDLKMKQPTAIDFTFKLSIFTTKYQKLNEFNTLINKKFNSCQCYISPNSHFMPMKLESINDESQYNIDDRQFYAQTYNITVLGYIITEEDYRVEENPAKFNVNIEMMPKGGKAEVEIDECFKPHIPYYFKPLLLTINYDTCATYTKFTMDTEFIVNEVKYENIRPSQIKVKINNEYVHLKEGLRLHDGDVIRIDIIKKIYGDKYSSIIIEGYDPITVYDEKKDVPEVPIDETQYQENTYVEAADSCEPLIEKEKDYIIGENEIKIKHN